MRGRVTVSISLSRICFGVARSGIAHAEVDDVGATCPRRGLQAVYLLEHVGRQPLDLVEFFHSGDPLLTGKTGLSRHDHAPQMLLARVCRLRKTAKFDGPRFEPGEFSPADAAAAPLRQEFEFGLLRCNIRDGLRRGKGRGVLRGGARIRAGFGARSLGADIGDCGCSPRVRSGREAADPLNPGPGRRQKASKARQPAGLRGWRVELAVVF